MYRKGMCSRLGLMVVLLGVANASVVAQNWPSWRGPNHDGISTETNLPDTWSATCAGTADFAAPSPSLGGPSDAAATAEQRGGQRPPGSNFEGRPLVPTVCANIETRNIAWRLPLPAYSGSTPITWSASRTCRRPRRSPTASSSG